MCQGISQLDFSLSAMASKAFSVTDMEIELCFTTLDGGNYKYMKSSRECMYYIAGWHAYTILKGSTR